MKNLVLVLLFLALALSAMGQDDQPGTRFWYSMYLNKKIDHRWSVDNFTLIGMRSAKQNFWLAQSNFGVNYRLNRFWTLSAGYGHSLYKYSRWWDNRYPQRPNFLNTVSFHSISIGAKRRQELGPSFNLTHRFTIQQYFPRFEKYQTRLQYGAKLSYRKSDLPMRLRPFAQGTLYYYHNGVPIEYFDEASDIEFRAAPNGIHRIRLKVGANFRPIKSNKQLSMTVYYGFNKELNLTGKDINVEREGDEDDESEIIYPFNDYGIIGIQVNYFF